MSGVIKHFLKGGDASEIKSLQQINMMKGEQGNMSYYLMDLERTLLSNVPYFWKGNKHGYTYDLKNAGLFSKEFAEKIVKQDLDKRTIMIHVEVIQKILNMVAQKHEKY